MLLELTWVKCYSHNSRKNASSLGRTVICGVSNLATRFCSTNTDALLENVLISSKLPKAFAASLLDYIGSQAQYLHTLMAITQTGKVESNQHGDRLRRVEMALEALRNVIKHNPGRLKKKNTLLIGFLKDRLKIQNSSLKLPSSLKELCWLTDLNILGRLYIGLVLWWDFFLENTICISFLQNLSLIYLL